MKRILCILAVLTLMPLAACAETTVVDVLQLITSTPAPSPEPAGETFASEDLIVTLPAGMTILDEADRAGYEAAVQADFPNAGRTVLAASNGDHSAALIFALAESDQEALSAAREAAERIIGSADEVRQTTLGENSFCSFACAVESSVFHIYCISDGARLLTIGASGLEEDQIETMLAGLNF